MAGGGGSSRRRTTRSVEAAAAGSQAQLRKCSTKRKAGKEAAAEKANLLSAKDIRWILSQKPEAPPARYQALKRRNPELVPRPGEEEDEKLMALYGVTRALYAVQERMPKLQEWVRGELKEKGYVEVDDEWAKRTAESQAAIDRDWPTLKAKMGELRLMDGPGGLAEGGDESESSDSDEDDLESVMKDFL